MERQLHDFTKIFSRFVKKSQKFRSFGEILINWLRPLKIQVPKKCYFSDKSPEASKCHGAFKDIQTVIKIRAICLKTTIVDGGEEILGMFKFSSLLCSLPSFSSCNPQSISVSDLYHH